MGCHTWFYAHLPEKEQEWEKELKEAILSGIDYTLKYYDDIINGNIDSVVKNQIQYDYRQTIDDAKNILELYEMYKDEPDSDFMQELEAYCLCVTAESDTIEGLMEFWRKIVACTDIESMYKLYYDLTLRNLEKVKNAKNFEDWAEYKCYEHNFGLCVIKDNKIYRDTTHRMGKWVNENYIFGKNNALHDLFRCYDYELKPCYSLEETYQRIEEYNSTRTEENKCVLDEEQKAILADFWQKFPDGIIEFG